MVGAHRVRPPVFVQTSPQRVILSDSEILLREHKRADTKSRSIATKESTKEFYVTFLTQTNILMTQKNIT